jgi:hypothetical protein
MSPSASAVTASPATVKVMSFGVVTVMPMAMAAVRLSMIMPMVSAFHFLLLFVCMP